MAIIPSQQNIHLETGNCNRRNKKIIQCSLCGYYKDEYANFSHRYDYIGVGYHSGRGVMDIYKACSYCGGSYDNWVDGHKWHMDGVEVNPEEVYFGAYIHDGVHGQTISTLNKMVELQSDKWEVETSITGDVLKTTAVFHFPDSISGWNYSTLNNTSYAQPKFLYGMLASGYENTVLYCNPSSKVINMDNKTMTVTHSIQLKNSNNNYIDVGYVSPYTLFYFNGGSITEQYSCSKVYIPRNILDPEITNTYYTE